MPDPHRAARGALTIGIAVLALVSSPVTTTAQSSTDFVPVTDAMLQSPAPADWLMWRRTLDGWGYSPLDEIDRDNVGALRMVWSRALAPGRQTGTPLVYDGVHVHAEPERRHPGDRCRQRRSEVGAPSGDPG